MHYLKPIILEILKQNASTDDEVYSIIRAHMPPNKKDFPRKSDLLAVYHEMVTQDKIPANKLLEKILRKKAIRTLSGVAVVAVLVRPGPCPANCVYCPTEDGVPKSYLSNEPAVMRAIMFGWDPYAQVRARLRAYELNGHDTDKIEIIIIGGTWSSYNKEYQEEYVKRCFDACNSDLAITASEEEDAKAMIARLAREDAGASSIEDAQTINETAKHRIIGMSMETRPDCISWHELARLRRYGCTRVEMGLQSTDDNVLKLVRRGHSVNDIAVATKKLRDAGFKITYHMMPGLPGATPESDIVGFKTLFSDQRFQPDQVKVYPTVVVEEAELYEWTKDGRYLPYAEDVLFNTLLEIKKSFPPYSRIVRLIRDIPTTSILEGNKIANLRQALQQELHKQGAYCKCTRCREARGREVTENDVAFTQYAYDASDGKEYFLSYTSKDEKILYAFLRLRIPSWYFGKQDDERIWQHFPELKNAAHIRELHTYGRLAPLTNESGSNVQHLGFGKLLMQKAEQIILRQAQDDKQARKSNTIKKIAVIAGIGVREYYRKLGYELEGTYMVKTV